MIPWQLVDQWKMLKNRVDTPVCTGEDIYCKEGFEPLVESRAISVAHPDLATSGGILETKKIADYCRDAGIPIALHQAGSPIVAMANVQCAVTIENFIALEMHSVDNPWWNDIVSLVGQKGPMIKDGYVNITDAPGLGIELNDEAVKEHLAKSSEGVHEGKSKFSIYPKGAFEDTSEWDDLDSHDRTWS